ncbi:MAG: hypothetical protein Q9227_000804 [Pyrenula ochraceoflavens]
MRKGNDLIPLLYAWRNKYQQDVVREERERGTRLGPEKAESIVRERLTAKQQELFDKPGLSNTYVQWLPILQLPVWVAFMDALRMMTGRTSAFVDSIDRNQEAIQPVVPMEPTLATEGALWFPDLLAYDSTHALHALFCQRGQNLERAEYTLRDHSETKPLRRLDTLAHCRSTRNAHNDQLCPDAKCDASILVVQHNIHYLPEAYLAKADRPKSQRSVADTKNLRDEAQKFEKVKAYQGVSDFTNIAQQ